jgi:aspartyl-tRNA(Asn)/glutamyl-tRNA(Gln) amidotransferase subunit A
MALASSFDQIGPVTKTVTDAEILFNATNVYDTMDSMSVPMEKRICKKTTVKKIGIPTSWVKGEGIEESIKKNFDETCTKLKNAGYELVDIELPLTEHSLAVYYIILPAEASSNLARYDGMRYGLSLPGKNLLETYTKTRGVGFGKEVRRRIMLGTYVLSHGYYDAYYGSAVKVQNAIRKEIANVFEKVDVIMTPTAPTLAFKFGEKMNDPMAMKLSDLFTVPANVAGIPGISIPSGKTENNLVHSVQFMAPHFGEKLLFEIGKKCEDLLQ